MLRRGDVPPPPRELQGQPLKVEYISVMAQAQKLVGTASMERVAAYAGNLSQFDQAVLDKAWRANADTVASILGQGKSAAFLTLGELASGQFRHLSRQEVARLKAL